MLKILCFELASWTCLPTTPRYLATCTIEMMVSVFLGFTIQCTFVRREFVPVLKEAHAQLATWCTGYMLYEEL